jgi:hypothetical protein
MCTAEVGEAVGSCCKCGKLHLLARGETAARCEHEKNVMSSCKEASLVHFWIGWGGGGQHDN